MNTDTPPMTVPSSSKILSWDSVIASTVRCCDIELNA